MKANLQFEIAMHEAYKDFKREFGELYISEFNELRIILKETYIKKQDLLSNLNSARNQIDAIKRQRDKIVMQFEKEDTAF